MSEPTIGDVVRLKTGGPNMVCGCQTFEYGYKRGYFPCTWFVGDVLQKARFYLEDLVVVERQKTE